MRSSKLAIAIGLIAIALLAWWQWPSSSQSTGEEGQDKRSQTEVPSTLEERQAARRQGLASGERATLAGVVVHGNGGAPIPGATVALSPKKISGGMISQAGMSPRPIVVQTNAEGRFSIPNLEAGMFSVSASASGFRPAVQDNLVLRAGKTRDDVRLELGEGGHGLTGTVTDIGGGPVAFAQVRAIRTSDFNIGTLFRAPFSTVTKQDGSYALHLEDGSYQVAVYHEDYRKADRQVIVGGTDRTADFTLTPGSVIEGVVLRRSDDAPVEGALVTVQKAGRSGGFVISGIAFDGGAQTDSDGKFRLGGLGSGAFELQAVAKHASARTPTQVELGIAETLSDVIVYVDDAYTISGFVVDRDDESVPEAGVLVGAYNFSPGAVFAAKTPSAEDGYFEIHGVHPGTYTIGAAAEERQPTFFGETLTIVDEDVSDLIVEVKSGATLRGRITPPQEAQVFVEVSDSTGGFSRMLKTAGSFLVNGKSDDNGEFVLRGVAPGVYKVIARAAGGDKGETAITVEGDTDGIQIAMKSLAKAEGVVVDASGAPVEGVRVQFDAVDGPETMGFRSPRQPPKTMTGPDGSFVFVGLDDGDYDVRISSNVQLAWAGKEGEEAYAPERVTVQDGNNVRGLRFVVIARNEVIRGSVVDSSGAPVADSWVTAKYIRDANSSATMGWVRPEAPVLADETGQFEIVGLRKGAYGLEAESPRGGSRGELEDVKTGSTVVVEVEALGVVTGTVRKAGSPVGDYILAVSGETKRRKHVVSESGTFRVARLEPGEYTIEVTSSAGAASTKATVESGKETDTSLTLAAFGSISGVLVDANTGDPVPDMSVVATVGASGEGDWAQSAVALMQGKGPKTDAEGRFRVGKLRSGAGTVYFIDPESTGFGMIASHSFVLDAAEDKDLGEIEARPGPEAPSDESEEAEE